MAQDTMQLEFPFTRTGAMQEYTAKQKDYFERMYWFHEQTSYNVPSTFVEFLLKNIPIYAPVFAKKYSKEFFGDIVDKQTEKSQELWSNNDLTDKLK